MLYRSRPAYVNSSQTRRHTNEVGLRAGRRHFLISAKEPITKACGAVADISAAQA
jgi:hypothetical protein